MQQISYEDVEKLFKTDPKGISNRKIIHKWNYPISAQVNMSACPKCKAELELRCSPKEQEMFNVIGKIHGQLEPGNLKFLLEGLLQFFLVLDRYIIVGSHRNYYNKLDTGTKTLLQLVDTFHTLKKQGSRLQ